MSNGYNVLPANKSLFRAKRKDNNDWIYWNMYGELCRLSGKRTRLAITKGAGTSYYDYIHQIRHLLIPETIGRFTTLTDMNGKKVFEGDVVKEGCNYLIGVVVWDNSKCTYKLKDFGDGYEIENAPIEWKVIGNIHDNPELMEKWIYG